MKILPIVGLAFICIIGSTGCDHPDEKKSQDEQRHTEQGTKTNAGEYKAAPLDLSMDTPTPSPSKPKDNP